MFPFIQLTIAMFALSMSPVMAKSHSCSDAETHTDCVKMSPQMRNRCPNNSMEKCHWINKKCQSSCG